MMSPLFQTVLIVALCVSALSLAEGVRRGVSVPDSRYKNDNILHRDDENEKILNLLSCYMPLKFHLSFLMDVVIDLDFENISIGVPQGSCLGPSLFKRFFH